MGHARSLLIALCLFGTVRLLAGTDAGDEDAGIGAGTVELSDEGSGPQALYRIRGAFEVFAPKAQVWDVLTDYSALKGVVSSMQASCVISREGNKVLVDQVAEGKFLFLKKSIHLRLSIEEQPQDQLSFIETSGKPFRVYRGSWTLEDRQGTVGVTYLLYVSRSDMAPPFIERRLFRENALHLLKELRAEIARRASQKPAAKEKEAT